MASEDPVRVKCNSGYAHSNDLAAHFFGCLRPSERQGYFNTLSNDDQSTLRQHQRHFSRLRSSLELSDKECGKRKERGTRKLLDDLKDKLAEWRNQGELQPEPDIECSWHPKEEEKKEYLAELGQGPDFDPDLVASMIYFKKSEPHNLKCPDPDKPDLYGKFP